MTPLARTPNPKQRTPLYDINPATGVSIEVAAARWGHSAGAAPVGFGGLVVRASHQKARRLVRSLRATRRIATRRMVNLALAASILLPQTRRVEAPPREAKKNAIIPNRCGAPEEIRTPDPQIRSLVLYPAELRARFSPAFRALRPAFAACNRNTFSAGRESAP
jgi:hypothetical protein